MLLSNGVWGCLDPSPNQRCGWDVPRTNQHAARSCTGAGRALVLGSLEREPRCELFRPLLAQLGAAAGVYGQCWSELHPTLTRGVVFLAHPSLFPWLRLAAVLGEPRLPREAGRTLRRVGEAASPAGVAREVG